MPRSNPVIFIRFRRPDAFEWEECCLQFQSCKAFLQRISREMTKQGIEHRLESDRIYTSAERPAVEQILRRLPRLPTIIDVAVPRPDENSR